MILRGISSILLRRSILKPSIPLFPFPPLTSTISIPQFQLTNRNFSSKKKKTQNDKSQNSDSKKKKYIIEEGLNDNGWDPEKYSSQMKSCLSKLDNQLSSIQVGRASPGKKSSQ